MSDKYGNAESNILLAGKFELGRIIDNSNDINKISSKTQLFSKAEELLESGIFSRESSFNDDEDFESSIIPSKKD